MENTNMEHILHQFLPNASADTLVPLGEGLINTTYAVTDADGKRYVLQKINTAVFPDPVSVMRNTICVTDWMRDRLRAEGVSDNRRVLSFVPCVSGGYLCGDWRCSEMIEGASAYVSASEPSMLCASGKGYGEFQRLLNGFPAHTLAEVLPDFHNTKKRFAAFLQVRFA